MKKPIVIGSRGSDLALWQAHYTRDRLAEHGLECEIKIIKTQGDRIQHLGFDKMEGKGFFTKEIEAALLDKEIDLAVHSHKDLETRPPEGLIIAGVSGRAAPTEYLLMHAHAYDALRPLNLKASALVGTSAARRKAQLLAQRPDLQINDLRGNVPTRIDKLRKGQYDAILVARAGVDRLELDLSEFVVEELDPRVFVPAPAQGVLAFQVRAEDTDLQQVLAQVNAADVATAIECERSVLRLMDGGCQVPYGGLCEHNEGRLRFWSFFAQKGGSRPRRLYADLPMERFNASVVLSQLSELRSASVLITRAMRAEGYARSMLQESGVDLVEQAFIETETLHPEALDWDAFQWLFFTSANAVRTFAHFDALPKNLRLAAIGKGTRLALQERGLEADFVGMGNTADVAAVFRRELGTDRVAVICAASGLQTVQKALNPETFEAFKTYRTLEKPEAIDRTFDIVAFTSPSNVRAFLAANTLTAATKVVSIGPATAAALEDAGIESTQSWESSEQALADTIIGLS